MESVRYDQCLMGLAVNLANNQTCAEIICQPGIIGSVVKRAVKNSDGILLKVLAGLARLNGEFKLFFLVYLLMGVL